MGPSVPEARSEGTEQALYTVPELFESSVVRHGPALAVVFGENTLDYAELNARANQLARRLIADGVAPDTLVAVAIPRSIDLVVVILAVLKAGGSYLPLDPGYPMDRLSHMVSDARPVLLVRAAGVTSPDGSVPEIVVDDPEFRAQCARERTDNVAAEERHCPLLPAHLMYVIYTSGSTGVPKGVAVPHSGVADLVATQRSWLGTGPGDRVLQWASISFDAAFWDLTLGLLSGATLVVAPADELLPGQPLKDTLLKHGITHAVLPPVALSITESDGVLVGGTVMSTGDACTQALAREWSTGRRMLNGYGPTEVTVGATIAGPVTGTEEVSIGKPWTGARVYVLDERLQEVPDGQEGELYLGGSGLARGYLNRPGVTAGRFVPDPFGEPGSRMYRSGDRGRRRADGELFFAGRADDQVKVRGFRIELGEIEAVLAGHEGVGLAVAVVDGELADARIVAHVTTAAGSSVTASELRSHAARFLPEHMVPATVLLLDRFPTLSNGKIDRAALRARAPRGLAHGSTRSWDDGSYEEAVCALVGEVLGVPEAMPHDNLFDLGGNSLLAAKLASRIRKELGVSVPMRSVFDAETLAELARIAEKLKAS
ncbi:amino acid adenylation domain-containing protein [Streptomyces sp. NPDC015032]|uniref:non-ribosomal peptide synthetase n=1 Tax=Streptomyces sp. NPDC015032 TaxID=3364937 RepID=UPI0036FC9DEA